MTTEIGMATIETKVPENILKKRKRDDNWAVQRAEIALQKKQKNKSSRKEQFKRAEEFLNEYVQQEKDLVRHKRLAKQKGGFYVPAEDKLLFVVRIKGINKMHPKSQSILRLLRLRQINNGVFVKHLKDQVLQNIKFSHITSKANKATINMLKRIEPYISWGPPSLKSIKDLIYKRGFGKVNKNRIALTDNQIIEDNLGKYNIICMEDIVHEIQTAGPHFKQVNNFLWPIKMSPANSGSHEKRQHYIEGGQAGDRGEKINDLIKRMN